MVISQLAGIAQHGDSDAARVSACGQLLNRGWGMPDQPHTATVDANIEIVIRQIIRGEKPAMKTINDASYTKEDSDDE